MRAVVFAILVIGFIAAFTACRPKVTRIENKAVMLDSLGRTSSTGATSNGDSTFQINAMAAVFYFPDSVELDSLKKVNGDHFQALLSENETLVQETMGYITEHNTRVLTTTKRYLQFPQNYGPPYIIDKHKYHKCWGLLLFDRENPPKEVDMHKIDFEYLQYYAK